jgi:hypothetical protein
MGETKEEEVESLILFGSPGGLKKLVFLFILMLTLMSFNNLSKNGT